MYIALYYKPFISKDVFKTENNLLSLLRYQFDLNIRQTFTQKH